MAKVVIVFMDVVDDQDEEHVMMSIQADPPVSRWNPPTRAQMMAVYACNAVSAKYPVKKHPMNNPRPKEDS